ILRYAQNDKTTFCLSSAYFHVVYYASPCLRASVVNERLPCHGRLGADGGGGDGVVGDLGDLAAGGVHVGHEVGAVLRIAGHGGGDATGIAADDVVADGSLDVLIEGAARRHVGEGAGGRVDQPPLGGIDDDLGQLAARQIVVRAEVGPILAV